MRTSAEKAIALGVVLAIGLGFGAGSARAQSRQEVWHAFLGVYLHTTPRDQRPTAFPVELPALERAAALLRKNDGFGASAIRRRAATRIGAAALRAGAPGELAGALRALGLPPDFLPSILRRARPGILAASDADREEEIQISLDGLPAAARKKFARACCAGFDFCVVDGAVREGGSTTGYFQLEVQRPVDGSDGLKDALDPQDWDECMSNHFDAVYRTGDACPQGPPHVVAEDPALAKPVGSPWKGAIFERFVADPNGATQFQNNLEVAWFHDAGNRQYCFDYDLCTPVGSIDSKVQGQPQAGGVAVDKGFALAQPSTSSANATLITGLKMLRFSPSAVALWQWANFTMAPALDMIASVGACCSMTARDDETCELKRESCTQAQDFTRPIPSSAKCQ